MDTVDAVSVISTVAMLIALAIALLPLQRRLNRFVRESRGEVELDAARVRLFRGQFVRVMALAGLGAGLVSGIAIPLASEGLSVDWGYWIVMAMIVATMTAILAMCAGPLFDWSLRRLVVSERDRAS
ncbi:MAG: hypothetical protein Q7W30_03380 [Coriobacteriia bacterium]|nr:hypothetical protein [Coriobacteriia bacterium]